MNEGQLSARSIRNQADSYRPFSVALQEAT
jgi:hypothetical protein